MAPRSRRFVGRIITGNDRNKPNRLRDVPEKQCGLNKNKNMKILLLQDVKKVGKRNEVKDVSDGYARNFLIPKKLAMPADEGALKLKKATDEKEADLIARLNNLSEKLKNDILEYKVKSGKAGEIFGSVSAEQIQKSLEEKGYGKAEVILEKPLRSIGDHKAGVNFGRGIKGEIKINLSPQH